LPNCKLKEDVIRRLIVGSSVWSLCMLVRPRLLMRFLMLVGVVGLAGCGQGGNRERNPTQERLFQIGQAYLKSCHALGRGPSDFSEIKDHVEGDLPGDFLVSPHDGKPFVILWGVDVTQLRYTRKNAFYVLAYEKTGVNDTRYVLRYPIGLVQMTDEELREAPFPPGHKAPS
jgi:hypothetical protein